MTALEGVAWNVPRTTRAADGVALVVATAAPLLAFLVLRGATARRAA